MTADGIHVLVRFGTYQGTQAINIGFNHGRGTGVSKQKLGGASLVLAIFSRAGLSNMFNNHLLRCALWSSQFMVEVFLKNGLMVLVTCVPSSK
jgi:hypothetical protein